MKLKLVYLLIMMAAWLGGCAMPGAEPTYSRLPPTVTLLPASPTRAPTLSVEVLQNAAYHSPDFGDFQLVEGTYNRGEAQIDNFTKLSDWVALGDLNADGLEDAVVILFTQSSGTGVFVELAAMLNQNGTPDNRATIALGDRVQLNGLFIESGVIQLEIIVAGPSDPLCCPTQIEQWRLQLVDDQLVRLP